MRPFSSKHLVFSAKGFKLLGQPSLQIKPDLLGVSVVVIGVVVAVVLVDVRLENSCLGVTK